MALTWTKAWTSADDGSVLGGADLKNLQDNVDAQVATLAVTQTITGNKTFSGTNVHSGTNTHSGTETFTGAVSFTEKSVLSLLSATTVPLNANGATTIYTVPAGKRCVLHSALLVAGADAGTSDLSIGITAGGTDFVGVTNLDNVDAQYDACILAPVPSATPAMLKSYVAGAVIIALVANQAGGATNTLYLFGFLYTP